MASSRHRFGTNIRNSIDAENFRKAARSVGADLRYWVSMGTVATVDTETGEFNPRDSGAIWNASDGIDVDVKLEPLEIPVTCRYAGIQAGEVTILAPIRPGDIVKCDFPDGDLTGGIITNVLHSRSNRQPTDQGKPIFGNDRLLLYAKTVPIDIRLAGAAGATPVQVLLEQDGTVTITSSTIKLGGTGATESVPLGDSQKAALDAVADAIQTFASSLSSNFNVTNPGGAAAALTALTAAITAFKAASTLSHVSKTT